MTTHNTPAATEPANDVLRYAEAAKLLAIPLPTLYSMVHDHLIPHYRVGARTVLFRRSELLAFLSERAVPVRPSGQPTRLPSNWLPSRD